MDVIESLKASYLTNHLTEQNIKRIADLAVIKSFMGGDVIVRQFDKNSDLMIVVEGKVRINSFQGEQISEGGPGSIIGEMSLIDDKPRSATVLSSGPCKVGVIKSVDFWKLLNDDPILARIILLNIGQVLCIRLRAANLHLDTIVLEKSGKR